MSLFRRYRWFALAGGITLAFAVVSLTVPRGPALTAISDIGYLLLFLGGRRGHAGECAVGSRAPTAASGR